MHGSASGAVGHLADRHPSVSPERLIAQLRPRCAPTWPPCLALIEGVTAVFFTALHGIDDQNVALRLVSLTDRLYEGGIPVVASGAKLDSIFGAEMLTGGYRRKYLRATSRLLAWTQGLTRDRES